MKPCWWKVRPYFFVISPIDTWRYYTPLSRFAQDFNSFKINVCFIKNIKITNPKFVLWKLIFLKYQELWTENIQLDRCSSVRTRLCNVSNISMYNGVDLIPVKEWAADITQVSSTIFSPQMLFSFRYLFCFLLMNKNICRWWSKAAGDKTQVQSSDLRCETFFATFTVFNIKACHLYKA